MPQSNLFKIKKKKYKIIQQDTHYATKNYTLSKFNLPLTSSAQFSISSNLLSSLVILAVLFSAPLTGNALPQEREACRSAGLSSCEVPGNSAVTPVEC